MQNLGACVVMIWVGSTVHVLQMCPANRYVLRICEIELFLCTPLATFDDGVVGAPVKKYPGRKFRTVVDLVSLKPGKTVYHPGVLVWT